MEVHFDEVFFTTEPTMSFLSKREKKDTIRIGGHPLQY